jgi:uncharacterized protein (TIGR03435 family)
MNVRHWMAGCAFLSVLAIGMADVRAQKFEVASVKPCKGEPDTGDQRRQEWRIVSPGRVIIECRPLERIIYFAYAGIGSMSSPLLNSSPGDSSQIRGGPGWMRSDLFTIEAKAEANADRESMMGPMLRAVLEERFHLQTHRGTEEAPMYALTVAKGGLKIKPIGDDGCRSFEAARDLSRDEALALNRGPKPICGNYTSLGDGANRTWMLGGETLTRFASQTLSGVLDRYVIDKTGVDGRFNIKVTFGLDESIRKGVFGGAGIAPPPADIERGPSIFTALEEQLGLKLESTKGPRQFLVIDRVERPDPN